MFLESFYKYREFEYTTKLGKLAKKTRKSICYILICDNCNSSFERMKGEMSPKRANNKYKHFCTKCGNAQGFAGQIGSISIRNKQNSLMGTKIVDSAGYISIYVGPDYIYTNTYGGRIREHIYIVQEMIGRQLECGEVIHHIDGDKKNNDISNLDLCTVKEHNNLHSKGSNDIIFELYKRNIIGYDRSKKKYYIIENNS